MTTQPTPRPLTDEERSVYEWQTWVPGFGEEGQELLKGAVIFLTQGSFDGLLNTMVTSYNCRICLMH